MTTASPPTRAKLCTEELRRAAPATPARIALIPSVVRREDCTAHPGTQKRLGAARAPVHFIPARLSGVGKGGEPEHGFDKVPVLSAEARARQAYATPNARCRPAQTLLHRLEGCPPKPRQRGASRRAGRDAGFTTKGRRLVQGPLHHAEGWPVPARQRGASWRTDTHGGGARPRNTASAPA